MCKEIGAELAAQKHATLLANCVAVELGLDDPNGPAAVLAQSTEILGERGTAEDANVVYMYLIHACGKLFDNELDQPTFEEHMRWFFGNKVGVKAGLFPLLCAENSVVVGVFLGLSAVHSG
jgi:paired amphipathic helix protein Sin3a